MKLNRPAWLGTSAAAPRPRPVARRRTQLLAAGAIGVGAVIAFALPAGAAVVNQSPPAPVLKLGKTATLEANGAVVFAPVTITCPAGTSQYLTVAVTENVAGGFIASGAASLDVDCTGQSQTVRLAVTPTQRAFTKGVAFGQASIDVCGPYSCKPLRDQHEIQIVKS
ncbi:hypothetical protein [Rugosimonospora africana]|uniref:Uncharacterized protein n=1 Tax=Rugosimonospora africana TaxID=556532 RepID=A0A8J3VT95_9ACTN|nr:hypothetical protein [Rugosimonospora africana]GIH17965.1 hypothetical protein Raf01_61370 [Rugosimonospora africana]